MIKIKRHIKLAHWLLMAVWLFLAAGCSNADAPAEPEKPTDQSKYFLYVNLQLPSGSKAWTDETGTPNEDCINDLKLVLYYKDKYFMEFDPSEIKSDILIPIEQEKLKAAFKKLNVEFESSVFDFSQKDFQVTALANIRSYDINLSTDFTESGLSGTSTIWGTDKYNFQYQTGGWYPEKGKAGIPMFGISEKVGFNQMLINSEIKLLRSLAKIEIVDNLEANEVKSISIAGVSISKANSSGCLIPDLTKETSWSSGIIQVTKPTLPSDVSSISNLSFYESSFVTDNNTKLKSWSIYVPECYLLSEEEDFDDEDSKNEKDLTFFVTINITGYQTQSVASLKMPSQMDGEQITALLRNHIYRFFIQDVNFTPTDVTVVINTEYRGDLNYIYKMGKWCWYDTETEAYWAYEIKDGDIVWYKYEEVGNDNTGQWVEQSDARPSVMPPNLKNSNQE